MRIARGVRSKSLFRIVLFFAAGSAVYVGTYRATLDPVVVADVTHAGLVLDGSREPHYRWLRDAGQIVFAPLQRIDYLIRPEYWDHYSDIPANRKQQKADEP